MRAVNLASSPLTSDASRQHLYRIYLQIQKWLLNYISVKYWGWTMHQILHPAKMTKVPAAKSLLDMMFCNCIKRCSKNFSCKKAGLLCSSVCGFCYSESCINFHFFYLMRMMTETSLKIKK